MGPRPDGVGVWFLHGARPDGSHLWVTLAEDRSEPGHVALLREQLPDDVVWSCTTTTQPDLDVDYGVPPTTE